METYNGENFGMKFAAEVVIVAQQRKQLTSRINQL